MLASLCKAWRGSQVSEERRRLIKKVLVLPGDTMVERKSVRFLELLQGRRWLLDRMEKKSVWLLMLVQLFGKESTPGKRYRC